MYLNNIKEGDIIEDNDLYFVNRNSLPLEMNNIKKKDTLSPINKNNNDNGMNNNILSSKIIAINDNNGFFISNNEFSNIEVDIKKDIINDEENEENHPNEIQPNRKRKKIPTNNNPKNTNIKEDCVYIERIQELFKLIDDNIEKKDIWKKVKNLLKNGDLPLYILFLLGFDRVFILIDKDSLMINIMNETQKSRILNKFQEISKEKEIRKEITKEMIKKIEHEHSIIKKINDKEKCVYGGAYGAIYKSFGTIGIKSCKDNPKVMNQKILEQHSLFKENNHITFSVSGELTFKQKKGLLLWEMDLCEIKKKNYDSFLSLCSSSGLPVPKESPAVLEYSVKHQKDTSSRSRKKTTSNNKKQVTSFGNEESGGKKALELTPNNENNSNSSTRPSGIYENQFTVSSSLSSLSNPSFFSNQTNQTNFDQGNQNISDYPFSWKEMGNDRVSFLVQGKHLVGAKMIFSPSSFNLTLELNNLDPFRPNLHIRQDNYKPRCKVVIPPFDSGVSDNVLFFTFFKSSFNSQYISSTCIYNRNPLIFRVTDTQSSLQKFYSNNNPNNMGTTQSTHNSNFSSNFNFQSTSDIFNTNTNHSPNSHFHLNVDGFPLHNPQTQTSYSNNSADYVQNSNEDSPHYNSGSINVASQPTNVTNPSLRSYSNPFSNQSEPKQQFNIRPVISNSDKSDINTSFNFSNTGTNQSISSSDHKPKSNTDCNSNDMDDQSDYDDGFPAFLHNGTLDYVLNSNPYEYSPHGNSFLSDSNQFLSLYNKPKQQSSNNHDILDSDNLGITSSEKFSEEFSFHSDSNQFPSSNHFEPKLQSNNNLVISNSDNSFQPNNTNNENFFGDLSSSSFLPGLFNNSSSHDHYFSSN